MVTTINIVLWLLVALTVGLLVYKHQMLRRQLEDIRQGSPPLLADEQAEHTHKESGSPTRPKKMDDDKDDDKGKENDGGKGEEKTGEEVVETRMSDFDRNFLERLTGHVSEEMAQGHVSIDSLASKMCLSRSQLNRRVHALTAMSTTDFTLKLKMEQACRLMREEPEATIASVAMRSGFDDPAYFTRIFRRMMGVPPSEYRRRPQQNKQE